MKDLTLKFADRADFSAFMESISYYDDESMQDDILIDVIGNFISTAISASRRSAAFNAAAASVLAAVISATRLSKSG